MIDGEGQLDTIAGVLQGAIHYPCIVDKYVHAFVVPQNGFRAMAYRSKPCKIAQKIGYPWVAGFFADLSCCLLSTTGVTVQHDYCHAPRGHHSGRLKADAVCGSGYYTHAHELVRSFVSR